MTIDTTIQHQNVARVVDSARIILYINPTYMANITINNVFLDEKEDRLFSDMASMLNKYPMFKVKTESGKWRSIFTRFGTRQAPEFLGTQKRVLEMFKRYVNYTGVKWYDSMVSSAESILKKHGA